MATVLVVDDEPDILALLTLVLEGAGHDVVTACDGVSALAEYRRKRPDLVLLDVKMPGMGGLEVLTAVRGACVSAGRESAGSVAGRGSERGSDIPVVLLSACAGPEEVARGLRAGATRYVTKPFRVGRLVALVESLLADS